MKRLKRLSMSGVLVLVNTPLVILSQGRIVEFIRRISPEKRGAQNPEYIIPPDQAMFERLVAASGGGVRVVAVAPELTGGLDFIQAASRRVNVSLGHTCADYSTAQAAFTLPWAARSWNRFQAALWAG